MRNEVYFLFAILKGKTESTRRPVNIFMTKNISEAITYFTGYMLDHENGTEYALYKIGNISNKLEIKPCKVFIIGGYECKQQLTYEYKMEFMKESQKKINKYKEDLEKAKNCNDITKALEILFGGHRIEN